VSTCRRIYQVYLPILLALGVGAGLPVAASGQTADPLDMGEKLTFHAENAYGTLGLAGAAAYAGILEDLDAPREWGHGAGGYAKRLASTLACSGIHAAVAFGLDTALHEDPRYFRSTDRGFFRRSAHAVRGTFLTRTDSDGETISAWRIGSAYSTAFLSNQWYPGRLNTARLGAIQGSLTLGFDMVTNLGTEFWPDIKRIVLRKK